MVAAHRTTTAPATTRAATSLTGWGKLNSDRISVPMTYLVAGTRRPRCLPKAYRDGQVLWPAGPGSGKGDPGLSVGVDRAQSGPGQIGQPPRQAIGLRLLRSPFDRVPGGDEVVAGPLGHADNGVGQQAPVVL